MACESEDQHAWELRGVTFDVSVGTVEDHECSGCGAFRVQQAPAETVVPR